jgi:hypothetical protein
MIRYVNIYRTTSVFSFNIFVASSIVIPERTFILFSCRVELVTALQRLEFFPFPQNDNNPDFLSRSEMAISIPRWRVSPAYGAALALVAIQVGMGILYKAVQQKNA